MDRSEALKRKVAKSLRAACSPHQVQVRLEAAGGAHVGGEVISTRFDKLKPSERQDLIWKRLGTDLSPHDATLISFIVAVTPREREALAASG
jgi:hypothetical protein